MKTFVALLTLVERLNAAAKPRFVSTTLSVATVAAAAALVFAWLTP